MPRILIDANSMVLRTGATHLSGIGRTTLELTKALDALEDNPFDITLLTQTFRGHIPAQFTSLKTKNIYWPIGRRYDWLRGNTPVFDWCAMHDLQHIPHNYACVSRPDKTVVTIHDAMFFSYSEEFLNHAYVRQFVPEIAKASRAIVTCSENSKADIVKYMEITPEKVTVIPWGVDRAIFFKQDKEALRRQLNAELMLTRPFHLAVSCDIGRKNTLAVLLAYRVALENGLEHDLVLVWGNPPLKYLGEFAKEIEQKRIIFLKNIQDTTLGKLYAAATLSWFPSKYEGFGLPILESMASGTPVVTCRNSSLVEVGGDAALYVGPDDIDTMADIMRTYDSATDRYYELMCTKSLEQAGKFNWEETARGYIKWYLAYC